MTKPTPLAICIEDVHAAEGTRYLRCVAMPGRQPGLRMTAQGTVLWQSDADAACELWVSGDERLILYRPTGSPPVRVVRGGRALDVPFDKPVVLVDQDEFQIGDRALRVHIHGTAPEVRPPSLLPASKAAGTVTRVAAVVALGAAMVGCNKIEVRETPPEVPAVFDGAPREPKPAESAPAPPASAGEPEPIEVRERPPLW